MKKSKFIIIFASFINATAALALERIFSFFNMQWMLANCMNVTDEYGMSHLIAKCPSCQSESLYCGKIPTKLKHMQNKEVLFCKKCKFITPVEEFKNMLASR
jgi:hypothetical protein